MDQDRQFSEDFSNNDQEFADLVDALLVTADYDKPDHLEFLLQNFKADVHIENYMGQSPLHLAVEARNFQSVLMILEAGGEPNQLDNQDQSALYIAVDEGVLEIARLLLERGADANFRRHGESVLGVAAINHNEPMIKLLLEHGAEAQAEISSGNLLLFYAVTAMDDSSIIPLVIKRGVDVNAQDDRGWPILFHAVRLAVIRNEDRLSIVKLLVQNGAEVSIRDKINRNILHHVALSGLDAKDTLRLMRYLDDQGAELAAKDNCSRTVLHALASNAQNDIDAPEVLEFVLDRAGYQVDERDGNGFTALHHAATAGKSQCCAYLLIRGADVNATNIDGDQSPLSCAIDSYDVATVELMLEHGAELSERVRLMLDKDSNGAIVAVLLRYLAKLQFLGLISEEDRRDIIEWDHKRNGYFDSRVKELKKMEKTKIFEDVTMLDILRQSSSVIAGYARNDKLIKGFEKKSAKGWPTSCTKGLRIVKKKMKISETKFPTYFKLTADRFEREVKKQRMLKSATALLGTILLLNDDINREILSYFSENDLKLLVVV